MFSRPLHLVRDPSVDVRDGGRVLIGGSPLRMIRLSPAGAARVVGWFEGGSVGASRPDMELARRLLDANLAHPFWTSSARSAADVTIVIPVKNDAVGAADACRILAASVSRIVIVDDGSADPVEFSGAFDTPEFRYTDVIILRHDISRGPGAARNTGRTKVSTELTLFLDADVLAAPPLLEMLLPHFNDDRLVAVAPRVRSVPGDSAIARYEESHSPLDLGDRSARVMPRTRVSYLPTAALLIRSDLADFDEDLRFGEDVDLIWSLVADGHTVRYEPSVEVMHRPRPDLGSFSRQRFSYASASAPLARRHDGSVVPIIVSPWSTAGWGAAVVGHPVMAIGIAGTSAALLQRKLGSFPGVRRLALKLAGRGHLSAGGQFGTSIVRHWWPLSLLGALLSARVRRVVLAAAVIPIAGEWMSRRPRLDPIRYFGLRLLDHISYGAGTWKSCLTNRTVAPLVPRSSRSIR